ncbi:jg208, partial [Pararge aegeria aegeria]
FTDERLTAITPDGTWENGSWKGIPEPCGANQKRRYKALRTLPRYKYQPRRDTDLCSPRHEDAKTQLSL